MMNFLENIGSLRKIFFSKKKNKGFTLLEVMISLSLLALFMVPLLITHANSIRAFTRSKEMTHQILLAEDRLALIEALGYTEEYSESGEAEEAGGFNWTANVSSASEGAMMKAEVFASSGKESMDPKDKEGVQLVTYIANLEFGGESEEEEEEGD